MKIILAIDSFKGCLTSKEAEEAAAKGILKIFPDCEIIQLPIADGGEGILETLITVYGGKYIYLHAHDPLMEDIETRYGVSENGKTVFIEMASVNGLPLLSPAKRNPLLTTSYGTGELIKNALDRGYRNFIIGIGGSATNDAGIGMLQALGFRFFDKGNNLLRIQGGEIMKKIARIDVSQARSDLKDSRFTIACDVNNPFCGIKGAAYVFARQKGADDKMIKELDEGMTALAKIIFQTTGRDIAETTGAGAAGGMGGAFMAFLNAELKPGIQLLFDHLRFKEKIKNADFIITGEGKADLQTGMGKVAYGVLQEAKKQKIPVVLLAGSIQDTEELHQMEFQGIFPILPRPVSLQEAMKPDFAKTNIERTVTQICRIISFAQSCKL